MRLMILLLSVLILTANLAVAHDIKTDYDRSAEFYKYKTFMWIEETQPARSVLRERIVDAVNAEMEARGLRLVTSNADLAVSATTATSESDKLEFFYAGLTGGWNWYHYWAPEPSITVMETFDVDTLVIDVWDTGTNRVIWWAAGNEVVRKKSEKSVKHLNKSVEKMFESFPAGA